MKDYTCPYCEKPIDHFPGWDMFGGINFICRNHGIVIVRFKYSISDNSLLQIDIYFQSHLIKYKEISIYPVENKMKLIINYDNIIELPIDKNLTPENFEQKIKTYLIFQ
jgi:hypothetical protein